MQSDRHDGLDTEVRLRLSSPADLVAAVPYLLGFHPRDSLVLVSIHGEWDRRVSLASRIDLPPPRLATEVVRELARVVFAQGCDEVLAVVVGATTNEATGLPAVVPHRGLVRAAREAFGGLGVPVTAALWVPELVAGATWHCYDTGASAALPDPATSPVAAATVAAGHVTYPDRGHLEQLVAPTCPAALERRSRLLDAHCDRAADRGREPTRGVLDGPDTAPDAFALLLCWVERAGSDLLELDDGDVVALCLALSDPMVRDAAFGLALGPHRSGAERLWTALVRESPDPEAAEPAVLLAHSALIRGNGALVGIALERAQQAWPGHRMSELFQTALDGGLGPDELGGWFADGAAAARSLLRPRGAG